MSAYLDGYRQGQADNHRGGAMLDAVGMVAQWATASEDWKSGWAAGYDNAGDLDPTTLARRFRGLDLDSEEEETMDPNETLRLIRLTIKQMRVDEDPGVRKAHADELAEYVEALDEWLSKGGFLPYEWSKP